MPSMLAGEILLMLRQKIGDGEGNLWRRQRMDDRGGDQDRQTGITVAIGLRRIGAWIAAHFELLVHEIDDPVIGDAGAGVEAGLARAVIIETALGYLNDENSSCGMIAIILAPADHNGDIGFGFRSTEVYRQLHARPETGPQN